MMWISVPTALLAGPGVAPGGHEEAVEMGMGSLGWGSAWNWERLGRLGRSEDPP